MADGDRKRGRFAWPTQAPHFQLTERDFELLHLIYRYRFARSTHLSKLLRAPHDKVSGRLKLLFRSQRLVRPTAQIAYFVPGGGTDPMAYGIANEGARVLREIGVEVGKLDWTEKNRTVRAEFLAHALRVTEFRVALRHAVEGRVGVGLEEDLDIAPVAQAADPLTMRPRVRGDQAIAVRPDSAALLTFPDGARRGFFLEMDRGTMPVARAQLSASSILRKLLSYDAAHAQGLHTRHFSWKTFRVLIVTNSSDRSANIQATAASAGLRNPHLFLFADYSCLESADLLRHPFVDTRGAATVIAPA